MMFRRHAAQFSAKSFENIATAAQTTVGAVSGFFETLIKMGVFAQAERENRRRTRQFKRYNKHHNYRGHGLNGARAMARRRCQIAAGSLTASNGLVLS
jgi:hypothetical protein